MSSFTGFPAHHQVVLDVEEVDRAFDEDRRNGTVWLSQHQGTDRDVLHLPPEQFAGLGQRLAA